jgi:hypothetical protein
MSLQHFLVRPTGTATTVRPHLNHLLERTLRHPLDRSSSFESELHKLKCAGIAEAA